METTPFHENLLRYNLETAFEKVGTDVFRSIVTEFFTEHDPSHVLVLREDYEDAKNQQKAMQSELEQLRQVSGSPMLPDSLLCTLATLARTNSTDLQVSEAWNTLQPDIGRLHSSEEHEMRSLLPVLSPADHSKDWSVLESGYTAWKEATTDSTSPYARLVGMRYPHPKFDPVRGSLLKLLHTFEGSLQSGPYPPELVVLLLTRLDLIAQQYSTPMCQLYGSSRTIVVHHDVLEFSSNFSDNEFPITDLASADVLIGVVRSESEEYAVLVIQKDTKQADLFIWSGMSQCRAQDLEPLLNALSWNQGDWNYNTQLQAGDNSHPAASAIWLVETILPQAIAGSAFPSRTANPRDMDAIRYHHWSCLLEDHHLCKSLFAAFKAAKYP